MRLAAFAVLAGACLVSGCANQAEDGAGKPEASDVRTCDASTSEPYRFWFAAGRALLQGDIPAAGAVPGNAFSSAFLTNDLDEWLSEPVPADLHILGAVTLEFWARNVGTPAPIIVGGQPGEGYHFFNQFGSNRSLQPGYAVEYAPVAPTPGQVDHYNETIALPEGGFVIERGDRVRVLLTDLALDGLEGAGHDILFGGSTPSSVSFSATCRIAPPRNLELHRSAGSITLLGNQGLLTGAIPATEGVNMATRPITVYEETVRITVDLEQTSGPTMPKQDVDVEILDSSNAVVWSVGSPYTNEHGTIYEANIAALFPAGEYKVRVHSYSGTSYAGNLVITTEEAHGWTH